MTRNITKATALRDFFFLYGGGDGGGSFTAGQIRKDVCFFGLLLCVSQSPKEAGDEHNDLANFDDIQTSSKK